MSYCSNCGAELYDGDVFCGLCGSCVISDSALVETIPDLESEAVELLVDVDGNVFSAAKALREKYGISAQRALTIANDASACVNSGNTPIASNAAPAIETVPFVDNIMIPKNSKYSIHTMIVEREYRDATKELAKEACISEERAYAAIAEYKKRIGLQEQGSMKRHVVKTTIIGRDSRKKVGSTLIRGAVGGAILGPFGLLAAATGKNKVTTTFLIEYSDGTSECKTVDNKSVAFDEYASHLKG